MVRAGAAGARPQLFRTGRLDPRRQDGDREPVLSHGSGVGADPAGAAVDRGDRHRLAGGDLRLFLAVAPGDAARPVAAARRFSDFGASARPNLYSANQLAAAGRGARAGAGVPQLERPRLGLRLCRHRNDDLDDGARRSRHARRLALAVADDRRRAGADHDRRPGAVRLELAEDPDRRRGFRWRSGSSCSRS